MKARVLVLMLVILAVLGIVLSALYLSGPATPYEAVRALTYRAT